MAVRVTFLFVWLVLSLVGLGWAPPADGDFELRLLRQAFLLEPNGIDVAVIAIFDLLGVIPLLYLPFLLADGRGRRLPAWPFALAMFALGAWAMLPYAALRGEPSHAPRPASGLLAVLRSRGFALFILASALGLLGWAVGAGSVEAYLDAMRSDRLVHAMTFDLITCLVVLPYWVHVESLSGEVEEPAWVGRVVPIPLFGVVLWRLFAKWRSPATQSVVQSDSVAR